MEIKEVTGFQTRVGMIFSSIEIACAHETSLIKKEIEQEFKALILELNPLIIKAREKIDYAKMVLGDECQMCKFFECGGGYYARWVSCVKLRSIWI